MTLGSVPSIALALALATVTLVPASSDRQWQPKLGGNPGEIVVGLDELEQSLRIVLTTPLGSVPGRPGFGSTLHEQVDQPITSVAPAIVKEVIRAVAACEPRITILAVNVLPPAASDELGRVIPEVTWKPTTPLDSGPATRTTQVTP
jgi:phage baseplate assembly protein W